MVGVYKFLDYNSFVEKFGEAHEFFWKDFINPKDVKVLYSDLTIQRINNMIDRENYLMGFGKIQRISDRFDLDVCQIKLPTEATCPYNDKIVLYTKDSCYQEGKIFEILLSDIEIK